MGLTKQELDQLLAWLDPDPGVAAEKYEAIRQKLITIFLSRQCDEAEDLADETINRVAKKVEDLKEHFVGEPVRYFHGVAKKLALEHRRLRNRPIYMIQPTASGEDLEPYLECLDCCLAQLSPLSRDLILNYYREKKQAKIASHKQMREEMRLNADALRVRAYRIRVRLEKCILECLDSRVEE